MSEASKTPWCEKRSYDSSSLSRPRVVVDFMDALSLEELKNKLEDALKAMTKKYVDLADSGDAGDWDSQEVS